MATIAIAGAGVLGRLLAWRLARAGHAVQVFDPAAGPEPPPVGVTALPGTAAGAAAAAGFTAAGMLSPLAELDQAGADIAALGWRSIVLWRRVAAALAPRADGLLRQHGSLLVAHPSDAGAARRVLARLEAVAGHPDFAGTPQPRALDAAELRALEPALLPGLKAWLLPGEGQVLPRETLQALAVQAPGVRWHWGTTVAAVEPHRLRLADGRSVDADLAIDVRGLECGRERTRLAAAGTAAAAAAQAGATATAAADTIATPAPAIGRRPARSAAARRARRADLAASGRRPSNGHGRGRARCGTRRGTHRRPGAARAVFRHRVERPLRRPHPACRCNARCGCCTRGTASTCCRGLASWWSSAPARSRARTARRSACAARSS